MGLQDEINIMKQWYSRNCNVYEMLYCGLFDRETAFMIPKHQRKKEDKQTMFRYYNIFKNVGLPYVLNTEIDYSGNKFCLNVYSSLGKYDKLPIGSGSPLMRSSMNKEWNEQRWKYCTAYDLFIDIDSPNREHMMTAKQDTLKIIELLDSYNMPYYLRFSGMGYHIIIPHKYFAFLNLHYDPDIVDGLSVYEFCAAVQKRLHDTITEFVDKNVHDCARVAKVPYSLTFYPDGCYVCWPFKTKGEFVLHKWQHYRLNNSLAFIGEQKIFKRGQTLFNETTWNFTHTQKFLKALKIEVKDAISNNELDG